MAHPYIEPSGLLSWYCLCLLKQSSISLEEAELENTPGQMVTIIRDLGDRCVSGSLQRHYPNSDKLALYVSIMPWSLDHSLVFLAAMNIHSFTLLLIWTQLPVILGALVTQWEKTW